MLHTDEFKTNISKHYTKLDRSLYVFVFLMTKMVPLNDMLSYKINLYFTILYKLLESFILYTSSCLIFGSIISICMFTLVTIFCSISMLWSGNWIIQGRNCTVDSWQYFSSRLSLHHHWI